MKEEMKKDFEKLYGELYDTINKIKNSNNRRRLKENDDLEYSRFTAMHGSEYWRDKDGKEKDIRFMLVGRAVNGWGEYSGEDDSKDSFVESSMANLTNDKKSFSKNQKEVKDRFEWIVTTKNEAPHNTFREGIDKEGDDSERGTYKLTRSPFWNYTKNIWDVLVIGKESSWSERWFEKIAWTNLYKIAPMGHVEKEGKRTTWGANPNTTECKKQEKVCVELLKKEIEYFKPTHLLFVTDRDGWYKEFENQLENFFNVRNIKEINSEYVKRATDYIVEDVVCKVVVVCRPETRPKEEYVKEVIEAFKIK